MTNFKYTKISKPKIHMGSNWPHQWKCLGDSINCVAFYTERGVKMHITKFHLGKPLFVESERE